MKGRVAVRLPGATGAPIVSATRAAGHNNQPAGTFRFLSAKVNSAGEFEIRAVAPGTYLVVAQIGREGRSYTSPAVPVTVAGANIEDLVLTIDSGVIVTGRIRLDGSTAHNFPKLQVKLLRAGAEAITSSKWPKTAPSESRESDQAATRLPLLAFRKVSTRRACTWAMPRSRTPSWMSPLARRGSSTSW